MIRVVFEPGIIQGRFIGEAEIAQVRLVLSEHGDWSRWRVSRHLAMLFIHKYSMRRGRSPQPEVGVEAALGEKSVSSALQGAEG